MKMTMCSDDELLARVMKATGAASKAKAIDLALREMDRKAKLIELSAAGLGLGPDELKGTIDPAYDLEARRGGISGPFGTRRSMSLQASACGRKRNKPCGNWTGTGLSCR